MSGSLVFARRQTDLTTLIVAFGNFANKPKTVQATLHTYLDFSNLNYMLSL